MLDALGFADFTAVAVKCLRCVKSNTSEFVALDRNDGKVPQHHPVAALVLPNQAAISQYCYRRSTSAQKTCVATRSYQSKEFNMRTPSFDALQEQTVDDGAGHGYSYASRMHPNPRFYKYRWWVFWRKSTCDGREFLGDGNSLCTADAMALIDQLTLSHECHWIYNRRMPRHEPGVTPFDQTSPRWHDTRFVPSFDEDTDPEWKGFR